MRILLITRGAPGAGKSTWIKNNHLENYTLCPDDFRLNASSVQLAADGTQYINQINDKFVWDELYKFLEFRMQHGDFTIVDATASKTQELVNYKKLCQKYRYWLYCVDFTHVPLDVCLKQNQNRAPEKRVPDYAIKNIYARFATQQVPSGVNIILPNELYKIKHEPIDLSKYKKIVHIGDIHGCYSTLMQYFENGLHDDWYYIFAGDYIDRGNESAKTMWFLNSIKDKPNVCLLEGNHERYLKMYGDEYKLSEGEKDKGYSNFNSTTKKDFIKNNFTEKDARVFYRKLRQISHYIYHEKEVLVCHGGIPHLNMDLTIIPTQLFINGVGTYAEYTENASTWMSKTKSNQFLVHGHRNTNSDEIQMADRVFNLEGRVEFGESLRIVELDEDGWHPIYLENKQPTIVPNEHLQVENLTIDQAINVLRNNKFINEKHLKNNISSFNFNRDAFYKQNWNNQTILARGLFIDTVRKEIRARSYEKFFRIDEHYTTELSALSSNLKFPVYAYKKENGFLAIISYDPENDDLFISSKSTNDGEFTDYIKNILNKSQRRKIKEFVKSKYENGTPLTLVFECIDIDHDPHIIEYANNKLVLLDAIYNKLHFSKMDYSQLKDISKDIEIDCKELAFTLNNWEEFKTFIDKFQQYDAQYKDNYIEGFVFEDSTGFMTKLKTGFYNEWKKMRNTARETFKYGYIRKTSGLINELENYFYGYCRELFNNKETEKFIIQNQTGPTINMITLRNSFLNYYKNIKKE